MIYCMKKTRGPTVASKDGPANWGAYFLWLTRQEALNGQLTRFDQCPHIRRELAAWDDRGADAESGDGSIKRGADGKCPHEGLRGSGYKNLPQEHWPRVAQRAVAPTHNSIP
jgi:hypothetical protein